jgi:ankyrin repeat protein
MLPGPRSDVSAVANNGKTALIVAANSGHEQCAQMQLDRGADVAAVDRNSRTALTHVVVVGGNKQCVQIGSWSRYNFS